MHREIIYILRVEIGIPSITVTMVNILDASLFFLENVT
jgi:hypothetical protein